MMIWIKALALTLACLALLILFVIIILWAAPWSFMVLISIAFFGLVRAVKQEIERKKSDG